MPRKNQSITLLVQLLLLLTVYVVTVSCQLRISKSSPCSCIQKGHYYNLRSLASEDGPAFTAMTKQHFEYAFNPCIPFSIGSGCKNVAVCEWAEKDPGSFKALGRQDNVTCQPIHDGQVALVFYQPGEDVPRDWSTTIWMKCNRTLKEHIFQVIKDVALPILQIEGPCCCPDGCPDIKPLPTPTQDPPSTAKMSGYIVGGVVGTVLFVALIAFAICGVVRHRRRMGYAGLGNDNIPGNVEPHEQFIQPVMEEGHPGDRSDEVPIVDSQPDRGNQSDGESARSQSCPTEHEMPPGANNRSV